LVKAHIGGFGNALLNVGIHRLRPHGGRRLAGSAIIIQRSGPSYEMAIDEP
jgi:hypothetical protein